MSDAVTPILTPAEAPPVEVIGEPGSAPVVLAVDHASPELPRALGDLGLDPAHRRAHAAWDPGALALARAIARRLGAPVVASRYSRLVHDVNRPPASPEAMPAEVEGIPVPGNRDLGEAERAARAEALYAPFHRAIDDALAAAEARHGRAALVTVHSFTPSWHGRPRAVEIGILHDADARLAEALLARLAEAMPGRRIARNRPYGPEDGVTHTLRVHALPRGLPNVMIEVRNDLLATEAGIEAVARPLADALSEALAAVGVPLRPEARAGGGGRSEAAEGGESG
ncbi:MAG: N-formylglutamate amidohydrolase [Alphaproteobacteria bacterium]|nr:MAG: N-formylglutamate amidohydrolase [Alphaproteobacteria bacterium]